MEIDKRLVFFLAPRLGKNPILMIGVPAACYKDMTDGQIMKDLSLEAVGMSVELTLFAAETHDDCIKVIEDAAKKMRIPYLDQRRKDFSIK